MEIYFLNKDDVEAKIEEDSILFFDMDDTLVHTNLANFESYKKAIQTVAKLDLNLTYDSNVRFNRTALRKILSDMSETQYKRIIIEKERCYNEFFKKTILDTNMVEILLKYNKTNRTVLVTNCRKNRALATLNYHGLTDMFDDIIYRENEDYKEMNKYNKAIAKLNISPKKIIVFENERVEIINAMNAGIDKINILII